MRNSSCICLIIKKSCSFFRQLLCILLNWWLSLLSGLSISRFTLISIFIIAISILSSCLRIIFGLLLTLGGWSRHSVSRCWPWISKAATATSDCRFSSYSINGSSGIWTVHLSTSTTICPDSSTWWIKPIPIYIPSFWWAITCIWSSTRWLLSLIFYASIAIINGWLPEFIVISTAIWIITTRWIIIYSFIGGSVL